jgi:hypothetical protein
VKVLWGTAASAVSCSKKSQWWEDSIVAALTSLGKGILLHWVLLNAGSDSSSGDD